MCASHMRAVISIEHACEVSPSSIRFINRWSAFCTCVQPVRTPVPDNVDLHKYEQSSKNDTQSSLHVSSHPTTDSYSYCHSTLQSPATFTAHTYCPLSASSRSEGQKNSVRCILTAAIMKSLSQEDGRGSRVVFHYKYSRSWYC